MTASPAPTRLDRLRAAMIDTGTDLVVLGPSSHMAWTIGLHPHGDERPVMLVVSQNDAGILIPSLNADMARAATDLPLFTWADDDGPADALSRLLRTCDAERPGLSVVIDETMRADFALLVLDALDQPRRRFTEDTVGALRARKDSEEARLIKASHLLNDDAVRAAFDGLRDGVTERQIANGISKYYEAHGATTAFCSVCFGASSAFPHHHPGDTTLTKETPVLIDTGCVLNGYPSDMTRVIWYGDTPDPEFTKIHAIVEDAVTAALSASKIGAPASAVDAAARKVITDAGYGPQFLHRTGHGLGIDIHEPPYVSASNAAPLVQGNVFSIEPGIYLAGRFGIRLEEIVILGPDGADIFSELPRTL